MKRLIYTDDAQNNLAEIYDFVADIAGDDAARATMEALRAKCRQLAELSGTLGRSRPELRAEIRSFPFRGYVIFFRYTDDQLIVVNILSTRRDVDAYFEADI
ncbi:MAG: type II toxin-antitoxin system RelE/ParE family toxin [Devosia sp.]